MEENKKLTFKDLIDNQMHEVYVISGCKCKIYKCKVRFGTWNPRFSYAERPKSGIIIDLYDKNGNNRILAYDYDYPNGYKSIVIRKESGDDTCQEWYDGYDKKMVYTTKDEAYRSIVHKLNEKKLAINKQILKAQENFGLIEKKKRFNINPKLWE